LTCGGGFQPPLFYFLFLQYYHLEINNYIEIAKQSSFRENYILIMFEKYLKNGLYF
jgi:hypothetical protein